MDEIIRKAQAENLRAEAIKLADERVSQLDDDARAKFQSGVESVRERANDPELHPATMLVSVMIDAAITISILKDELPSETLAQAALRMHSAEAHAALEMAAEEFGPLIRQLFGDQHG